MFIVCTLLRNSRNVHMKRWICLSSVYNRVDGGYGSSSNQKSVSSDDSKSIISKVVRDNNHVLLKRLVFECDPYDVLRREINLKSTEETPNLVPSESNKRITGCICAQEMSDINWMELHQGETTQCFCGHWFKLVTYEQYFEKVKLNKALQQIYSIL